jgi:hypothetical protein
MQQTPVPARGLGSVISCVNFQMYALMGGFPLKYRIYGTACRHFAKESYVNRHGISSAGCCCLQCGCNLDNRNTD